jgi:CBS domain-containing protein
MSEPPITVSADTYLDEAARLMEWHKIHRLIVVGPDAKIPLGILSASDVVRALGESDE